jgi:hypothetical protein
MWQEMWHAQTVAATWVGVCACCVMRRSHTTAGQVEAHSCPYRLCEFDGCDAPHAQLALVGKESLMGVPETGPDDVPVPRQFLCLMTHRQTFLQLPAFMLT